MFTSHPPYDVLILPHSPSPLRLFIAFYTPLMKLLIMKSKSVNNSASQQLSWSTSQLVYFRRGAHNQEREGEGAWSARALLILRNFHAVKCSGLVSHNVTTWHVNVYVYTHEVRTRYDKLIGSWFQEYVTKAVNSWWNFHQKSAILKMASSSH